MTENSILFIFEGQSSEEKIVKSLKSVFFPGNTIITCAFCQDIYELHRVLADDGDLDIFNLLKEIEFNKENLAQFTRDDFAEIYMFFDYDGHASKASDEKLNVLLGFFNEETNHGKLFLSYPMVESLRHISSVEFFKKLRVSARENIGYKNLVHEEGDIKFQNLNRYDQSIWSFLVQSHLSKMNYIKNQNFSFPSEVITQDHLFLAQKENYIQVDSTIAVVSAFPAFLHEYFNLEDLKSKTNK